MDQVSLFTRIHLFSLLKGALCILGTLINLKAHGSASEGREILSYEFIDSSLKLRAFQPRTQGFERLEFLGDRVLGLATAHLLYENYPSKDVGVLAKAFEVIVSKPSLVQMYESLNIEASELLSSCYQPPANGCIAAKTASDVVEALIGAVYKDGGFRAAQALSERLIKEHYKITNRRGSVPAPTLTSRLSRLRLKERENHLFSLQDALSYHFTNSDLLYEAFRHPSVGGNIFKKLDFIGVRVLALAIADKAYSDYPESGEGLLMQVFERTINNDALEKAFQSWQLWRYLDKQHGDVMSSLFAPERAPKRMAVNTVRALLGATYLDGGWQSASFITHTLIFSAPPEAYIKPTRKFSWKSLSTESSLLASLELDQLLGEESASTSEHHPAHLDLNEWPALHKEKATLQPETTLLAEEHPATANQDSLSSASSDSSKPTYRQILEHSMLTLKEEKKKPSQQEEWPALSRSKQGSLPKPLTWPANVAPTFPAKQVSTSKPADGKREEASIISTHKR